MVRSKKSPFLTVFDVPDPSEFRVVRVTVPLGLRVIFVLLISVLHVADTIAGTHEATCGDLRRNETGK